MLMSTFANVVVADDAKKSEFLSSQATGAIGTSPFIQGTLVKINGYETVQVSIDGAIPSDAPYRLIFKTNVGDLALTMLFRSRVDANGNIVKPKGTFNDYLAKTISENPNITVEDLAKRIILEHSNIKVTRSEYVGLTKDGRQYPASIVGFDIV